VYDERDRDDDQREGLMHDLDLPRGEERDLVGVCYRVYDLDGEKSRTAVGGLQVVPEAARRTAASTFGSHEMALCERTARTRLEVLLEAGGARLLTELDRRE
jgi:hypothetical protein